MNPSRHRAAAVTLAATGCLVVCGYALLALVQILWLNPLAAVPGAEIDQIWEDMAAANESMQTPMVVFVMALGPLLAVGLLVAVLFTRIPPTVVAVVYLLLLALGPIAYFAASFGPGMGLADTYGIGGADYSPWARPLYAISVLALAALVGIGIVSVVRRLRRSGSVRHSPSPA
ncbi:hypothetical protein ACLQ2Q_21300 [Microbacterium sp. DT81.1]|uniref:hypothetical protein n=1 Tax=Microbacterium sp. DT81.1 TaxID=3393413 RepID=UPI003CF76834